MVLLNDQIQRQHENGRGAARQGSNPLHHSAHPHLVQTYWELCELLGTVDKMVKLQKPDTKAMESYLQTVVGYGINLMHRTENPGAVKSAQQG